MFLRRIHFVVHYLTWDGIALIEVLAIPAAKVEAERFLPEFVRATADVIPAL